MNKLKSANEAIGQLEDGMTIGIGGWGPRRKPMALVREILRTNLNDLTLVSYGGADVGMLCAAGRVSKLIFAFVSLDFIPLEPFFRQARQSGKLDVLEIDEGMMLQGLRAAAWRIPFIPTAVGLGTDIIEKTSEIKMTNSPYDNKEWVAMPALDLDAALIHVDHADCRGVCQISGPDHYMDDWFARAAQNTIVSCDELVPESFFNDENAARKVFWERAVTDSIVLIAGGAHPSSCAPLYGFDSEHFRSYAGFAKTGGIENYLEAYLGRDENDYQSKVGGLEVILNLPLPTY